MLRALGAAAASRAAVTALAAASDWLLADHEPDGALDVPFAAECEHAAKLLGLSDTVAETDGMAWSYDPTGCYFEDGALKFNEQGNTGLCSLSDECICKR